MRLCPTVEGSPSPLITHRIGTDVCLAHQGANFHKCHKCIYRGKPADWKSEEPPHLTIELEAAGKNGTPPPARRKSAPTRRRPVVAPGKVAETEA